MEFDIFFSICQTPVDGYQPNEATMFRNFFDQVEAADELGFSTAWIAESHLSSEVQKRTSHPVIPHWEGEVGLNVDFLQLSHQVFRRTKRIETGSAIMNIICNGGPIAAAERVASFCTLHGLDPEEKRRINVGFAFGRFDFMNRAAGIRPRNAWEDAAWPALKGIVFREAAEIFLRLLRGEVISSEAITHHTLTRANFRSDEHWEQVRDLAGVGDRIPVSPRWEFEVLEIVPREWRRDLVQLIVGSHEAPVQEMVNRLMPVQVFNLSITQPAIIEDTHRRMERNYHADGGPWRRSYMPRTVFVFLNAEAGSNPSEQSAAAHEEARAALSTYWKALQGTIDPVRVQKAADNALIGNANEVAAQIHERYHPEDRLMLWFDFFNHDNARVIRNMEAFKTAVAPLVNQ
jgi:alkanesulfonate monooxygenase SsuD/methylene tetrahydromethanopterin reductase-like flavin-dependent oxidoreductase (luciferase family)